MKLFRPLKYLALPVLAAGLLTAASFNSPDLSSGTPVSLPYKAAGLSDRQAAAHLLSRFTFGATPGQVDEVVAMGLEKWVTQQLNGDLPDDSLRNLLREYDALTLTNEQIVTTFPRPAKVLREAIREGVIDKDSVNKADKQQYREQLEAYAKQKGFRPEKELFRQFANQKVLRAACSQNQLQEVLTDFWFNHFNVSMTKGQCVPFIPNYERDAIRPHTTGKFGDLLLATAQSPAMLLFLDNFSSTGDDASTPKRRAAPNKGYKGGKGNMRDLPAIRQEQAGKKGPGSLRHSAGSPRMPADRSSGMNNGSPEMETAGLAGRNEIKQQKAGNPRGLNENYAREVMELHTLGVDGGYTQEDVTQAARVLTGWTLFPLGEYGGSNAIRKLIEKAGEDRLAEQGFVHRGDFLFTPNRHDSKEKTVLGKKFPAGGGYEEGVELLNMLAHHPSTAKFIAHKLAVRFVSDDPPQSLVDKMAKAFLKKDGNIKEVLKVMVGSPEFWAKDALREKTKSPFELAISAIRALNATIGQPFQVYNWVDKMGQKLYYYQAPTGFPDKGQYWINTGSLLSRMNFGLALAAQRVPGVRIDLMALNHDHEPESAGAALETYCKLIMPERELDQTITRLTPLLNDPELSSKVEKAAGQPDDSSRPVAMLKEGGKTKGDLKNNRLLAQVAGIIIGSPEFQRR